MSSGASGIICPQPADAVSANDKTVPIDASIDVSDAGGEDDIDKVPEELGGRGDSVTIVSFDIGKKNFAYSIERYGIPELAAIQREHGPLTSGRRIMPIPNARFVNDVLPQILRAGTTLRSCVIDLRADPTSTQLDMQTRKNIVGHLEQYRTILSGCDYAIIEQQLFSKFMVARGGKKSLETRANMDAIKISEIVVTWLLARVPATHTSFISSDGKTHALGAPPSLGPSERKQWSIAFTRKVYTLRGDMEMLKVWEAAIAIYRKRLTKPEVRDKFIDDFRAAPDRPDVQFLVESVVNHRQKLDDISDCVLQCAFFVIKNFAKFTANIPPQK